MKIIYFSGNGNTKHCAQEFSKRTGNGEAFSIEDDNAIKAMAKVEEFGFAYPVHFSNIPFIVSDFIKRNSKIFRGKKIFLIATMGLFSGDGTGCAARLLKKYGAEILGGVHLRMPDAIGDVGMLKKTPQENKDIIEKTDKKIKRFSALLNSKKYPHEGLHFYNHIAGLFGQRLWFLHEAKKHRKGLKVDITKCTGCTLCAKQCPTQSISIVNGKAILTGNNCTICYRCVNSCPQKALTIIGKQVIEQCFFKNY
ncbi:EFR1 family ferrodoxin [Treponema pectinovorum]|uniref:EFR1 family ferrodoxin n=1 Tax=Treponema pectinovorum TaxID=164 RepID=UPI0011CB8459|nr:EFR1 family ferrodoxin [Treponema pectinovorum]